MSGIIFPSDNTQALDWSGYVSPNPLFNCTARDARAFNAGIEALGLPNFEAMYIQGQYGFGAAAVAGAATMDLSRAIYLGLDEYEPVNIMGRRGDEGGFSLAMTIKPFRSNFAAGLTQYVKEIIAAEGSSDTVDQRILKLLGRTAYELIADKFAAGMRSIA